MPVLYWDVATQAWLTADGPLGDTTPDGITLAAQGLIAQTFDRQLATLQTIMVSQNVYYMLIPLRQGQVITSLSIAVNTVSASSTLFRMGLYNSAGALVASTVNAPTLTETSGIRTANLSAPYTVPASGGYYVALLSDGGTPPVVFRASLSVIAQAVGSGLRPFAHQTAQANLPATATFAAAAGATFAYWVGAS